MELEARLFTRHAGGYLAALVGLWEHTYPVRHDALTAEISLSRVQLVLTADGESMSFRLVGDEPDGVCEARAIVERHLARAAEQLDEPPRPLEWHELTSRSSAKAIS